tara:strand:+ start:70 stop:249 length:180 start_codon:yes stop_codon:yes gene_type:complete
MSIEEREYRVLETCTIVREGYIKAKSLEEAEEIANSDAIFDITLEVTEEYTDNIEVWDN